MNDQAPPTIGMPTLEGVTTMIQDADDSVGATIEALQASVYASGMVGGLSHDEAMSLIGKVTGFIALELLRKNTPGEAIKA